MSRNISLDLLKLVMAFMVVGIHASFLTGINEAGNFITTQGLFRIAVPVFLIINGYYFVLAIEKQKVSQWLMRIVMLYFFWMTIYSTYWLPQLLTDISILSSIKLILKIVIGYYHLWYLPAMVGAALIVYWFRYKGLKFHLTLLFLLYGAGVTIQYLGNYHAFGESKIDAVFNINWIHRNFLFFAYPLFCIGFLIHKHQLLQKVQINQSAIICLIGAFAFSIEIAVNYITPHNNQGFDNYFSLLLLCPALFILFAKLNFTGNYKTLALYASGIYFIHPLLIFQFEQLDLNSLWLTALTIVGSSVCSYILIKPSKRFKFIL